MNAFKKTLLASSGLALAVTITFAPALRAGQMPTKDIVDTAVAAGSFKTLAAAL